MVQWCWVNSQCWGVLLIWRGDGPYNFDDNRARPTALAVGAGCLEIFTLLYPFSPLPISGRRPDIDCHTALKGR